MELTDLVEQAIRSDFVTDDIISTYAIVQNDFAPNPISTPDTPELPAQVIITCTDSGDLQNCAGAGIKIVDVEVKIEMNLGAIEEAAGRVRLLSMLAERVDDRLMACSGSEPGQVVLQRFVRAGLKIYGIMAEKRKLRSNTDLSKERIITREFVCAQIG